MNIADRWVFITVLVATGGVFFLSPAKRPSSRLDIVDVFPEQAAFALSFDPNQPAQSRLRPLLTAIGAENGSPLAEVERRCGTFPVDAIQSGGVVIPDVTASNLEFAVVLLGELVPSRVVDCASRVVRSHGEVPVQDREGDFVLLRLRRRSWMVAASSSGVLVVGGERAVAAVLRNVQRLPQRASTVGWHRAARRMWSEDGLVASWQLPEQWLEQIGGLPNGELAHALRIGALRVRSGAGLQIDLVLRCEESVCAERRAALQRVGVRLARVVPLASQANVHFQVRDGNLIVGIALPSTEWSDVLTTLGWAAETTSN